MAFKKKKRPSLSKDRKTVRMYRGREPTDSETAMRDYTTMMADLIVVDESNSFSEFRRGSRKYLTVVCSRTSEYGRLEKIADKIPQSDGVRKKHWNMKPIEIENVVKEIEKFTETELLITEEHRYIHYAELSDSKDKKDFYIAIMENAIENIIRMDPNKTMIIIMDNPPINVYDKLWNFGERLHAVYPNITWFETRPSSGTRILQVHDIITGAVADHVEHKPDKGGAYAKLKKYLRK